MRGSRILTGAVISAAAVALAAGTAFAEGSLDITPQRAVPGQSVTVTAMGCGGQGVGSTTASLATFPLTPIPSSRPLVVTGSFRVKDNARPGEYTVRVSCPQLADPGGAADPHLVQELFSQVTVDGAARAQQDVPAAPKAAAAKRHTTRAADDEWDDPYGDGGASRQDEASNGRQDQAGVSGQDQAGVSRQDEGGSGHGTEGGDARHDGAGGEGGGGRNEAADSHQEKGDWSGGGGQENSSGKPHHNRPQDGVQWQGGGWSHQGPHTGVGGAFGMDAAETAAGSALVAAAAAGGLYLVRRRTRRGPA